MPMGKVLLREWIRNVERYASRAANPLARYGMRIHSQGLQDGFLAEIFRRLDVERGSAVEIGAWDGIAYSNTRALLEAGWRCGYIEADATKFAELQNNIKGYEAAASNRLVTLEPGERLDDVISTLSMPDDLTLLCLDIDSHEFWIWRSLERFRPLVVCVEYNAYFDPQSRLTMPYRPGHHWTGGYRYGATAGALHHLGQQKGYTLVGFEPGLDLFFVRNEVAEPRFKPIPIEDIPRGLRFNPFRERKDAGTNGMVSVDAHEKQTPT